MVLSLAIGVLLILPATTMALQMPVFNKTTRHHSPLVAITPSSHTADHPPSWANGNFTGEWGIDIWGQVQIPIGWLFGYYKRKPDFGYFYAAFNTWNGEDNETSFLQGFFFGPYMLGTLGQNESANETAFVGLGGYNNTNFSWRVMGLEGPTFFMSGEYTKFS